MKKRLHKFAGMAAGILILASAVALPASGALAQTVGLNVGASATANATTGNMGTAVGIGTSARVSMHSANLANSINKIQTRADQEIARRIAALNTLSARVNAMTKIASSSQSALSANIATQVTAMNTLQAQIASDIAAGATSSLKADIQSITKSYRIFALIIPQGAIEAAADRVLDIAGMMTALAGQLQTRITAAQNADATMSAEIFALADLNAKVADVNTQVNVGVSEIANLQPDNGNATIQASNTAALKDARTKVQIAQQDLTAARKDAGTIVKALVSLKVSGSATATGAATASGTGQ